MHILNNAFDLDVTVRAGGEQLTLTLTSLELEKYQELQSLVKPVVFGLHQEDTTYVSTISVVYH